MKKEKCKNIIGFFIFMIILGVVFSKVTWLFRGNDIVSRKDVVGYKNESNLDVVFYGGSTLIRYFSPLDAWNQSGMVTYNYATFSAKVDIVKEYIEDSRTANNALLYVVDIRTFPLVIDEIDESSLRNWSDSLPIFSWIRWQGISSFLFTRDWKETEIPSYYFDIIKYHTNAQSLAKSDQWNFIDGSKIYGDDKGFYPLTASVPFETPSVCDERGTLTEQQRKALDALLDYCDAENLSVLFIVCPYNITESDWRILNTCGDIIQDRGYDYVNFNHYYNDIGLDFETDIYDTDHVNYLGSIKYTEYLTNYLVNNYNIPDHREESAYSQWNDDYRAFETKKEKWYQESINIISSHMEAKSTGEKLPTLDNFENWLQKIQNNNFTVIIKKNKQINVPEDDDILNEFVNRYGIEPKEDYYIGVWKVDECLFSTNGSDSLDMEIGIDGGRGKDQCVIASGAESQLSIAGIDYCDPDVSIQVIVYDNNYKKVVDHVGIEIDGKGNIILCR